VGKVVIVKFIFSRVLKKRDTVGVPVVLHLRLASFCAHIMTSSPDESL